MSSRMVFSREEFVERVKKVKQSMSEKDIDVMLTMTPGNMFYLTGYNASSYYVPQIVVLALDDPMPRYIGRRMDALIGTAVTTWLDQQHVHAYPDDYLHNPPKHPAQYMAEVLKELGYGKSTIGVEMDGYYFTAKTYECLVVGMPDARFVDANLLINWVKCIKSDNEVELIRRAGEITKKGMLAAYETIEPGVRQCDVIAAVYKATISGTEEYAGDYSPAIPYMPTGEFMGVPHLTFDETRFKENDQLYLEFSGCHKRYACPMSRNICLGKPSEKLMTSAKIAIEGLQTVLDTVKAGITCDEVAAAHKATLAKYGREKDSRIGYSIGANFPPSWAEQTLSIRPGDMTVLQPNMVIHCIPGLYYDDHGISISQVLRVTETGCEKMYDFPYDVMVK